MTHNLRNVVQTMPHLFAQKKISPMQIFGIMLLLCIPVVELASLYSASAGKIGTICWIFIWLYMGIFSIQQLIHIIKTTIHHKSPLALLTIGLFLFLCATNLQSMYSINGENTQEISCALSQLQNSPDWGYRKSCLFGYPTRQFIVPALPSLALGNSLFALNVGGVMYFVVGLILFCRGIQIYGDDYRKNDILTLLFLASLLHFHYVNHFLFLFEQSIFPLSFALALCGIWLMYLKHRDNALLIPFTLMMYIIIFAYTPSLALIPLSYGAILVSMMQNKSWRFRMLGVTIVAISALMTLSSFLFRTDIRFGHQYPGGLHTALLDTGNAIKHLALHIYPTPFTTWVFTPLIFIMILLPLMGLFGTTAQVISLWCLGVLFVSMYAKGYTYYHIEFRMHRALVTLPVLLTVWAYIANRYRKHIPFILISLAALGITISGLQNYSFTQLARPISQQYKFLQWLTAQTHIPQNITLYTYDAQTPKNNLISLRDISQYFTPELLINNRYKMSKDCSIKDIEGIFLILETHDCTRTIRDQLSLDTSLSLIGTYTGVASEPLWVFSRKSQP